MGSAARCHQSGQCQYPPCRGLCSLPHLLTDFAQRLPQHQAHCCCHLFPMGARQVPLREDGPDFQGLAVPSSCCWQASPPCALQVPSPEDDFGTEAAQLLAELLGGGKELNATIVQRERSATKVRLPGLCILSAFRVSTLGTFLAAKSNKLQHYCAVGAPAVKRSAEDGYSVAVCRANQLSCIWCCTPERPRLSTASTQRWCQQA